MSMAESLILIPNPSKGTTQECVWEELGHFILLFSNQEISLQVTQLPLDHIEVRGLTSL